MNAPHAAASGQSLFFHSNHGITAILPALARIIGQSDNICQRGPVAAEPLTENTQSGRASNRIQLKSCEPITAPAIAATRFSQLHGAPIKNKAVTSTVSFSNPSAAMANPIQIHSCFSAPRLSLRYIRKMAVQAVIVGKSHGIRYGVKQPGLALKILAKIPSIGIKGLSSAKIIIRQMIKYIIALNEPKALQHEAAIPGFHANTTSRLGLILSSANFLGGAPHSLSHNDDDSRESNLHFQLAGVGVAGSDSQANIYHSKYVPLPSKFGKAPIRSSVKSPKLSIAARNRCPILLIALIFAIAVSAVNAQPVPPTFPAVIHSSIVRTNRFEYDLPLTLSWDGPTDVLSFDVYISTNAGSYFSEYATTATGIVLTNLIKGWRYWFSVRSINSDGYQSAMSQPVSFSGRQTSLWMFVWNAGNLVESNLCVGTEFYQIDEAGVWSSQSPTMSNPSFFCVGDSVTFSNVVTLLP